MAVYNIPEVNGTGMDVVLSTISGTVNIFTPFLLLFIFCLIFITGYRKQKNETGNGDAPLWATIGGIATSVVALILSTRAGLIDVGTLVITIVITIMAGIWLFSSQDRQ